VQAVSDNGLADDADVQCRGRAAHAARRSEDRPALGSRHGIGISGRVDRLDAEDVRADGEAYEGGARDGRWCALRRVRVAASALDGDACAARTCADGGAGCDGCAQSAPAGGIGMGTKWRAVLRAFPAAAADRATTTSRGATTSSTSSRTRRHADAVHVPRLCRRAPPATRTASDESSAIQRDGVAGSAAAHTPHSRHENRAVGSSLRNARDRSDVPTRPADQPGWESDPAGGQLDCEASATP
jgi:hypothetical protein